MIVTDSQDPQEQSSRKIPLGPIVPSQVRIEERIMHSNASQANLHPNRLEPPSPLTSQSMSRAGSSSDLQGSHQRSRSSSYIPAPLPPGAMSPSTPRSAGFPPGSSPSFGASSPSVQAPPYSSHASVSSSGSSSSPNSPGQGPSSSTAPTTLTLEAPWNNRPPSPPIPFGAPPGYSASRLNPATAVKYQFSQLSFNSMLLVPPPSSPDTRPLYHISVHLNCFMPFSFITSVRRGGSQDGEFVGEFELGVNAQPATLFMDGEEVYLNSVLVKTKGSHQLGRWAWKRKKMILHWHCEGQERFCHPANQTSVFYAKFHPSTQMRKRNQPAVLPELEIFPSGHQYFDDILMSALLLERQRLTPGGTMDSHKTLFNYRSV